MSLKKLAALAGTSVATVSRVLSRPDYQCSDPALQKRIWELAEELDYHPNPSARELRLGSLGTGDTFKVDFFLARFDSLEKDLFFQEVFQFIKGELMQRGCLLGKIMNAAELQSDFGETKGDHIPYKSAGSVRAERRLRSAVAMVELKKNTGLIILGKCPRELIVRLQRRYSCMVGIDRNPTEYEYDEVVCDGAAAAQKAVEYLIGCGHREIDYIGDCTYESRYIGYYQSLLAHRIPLDYANIHPTDQTEEEGFRAMTQLLEAAKYPKAVFCANDTTAFGVLRAVKTHKKRGYHPSVISIDNTRQAARCRPALTSIDMPKRELAHLAMMLLLDRRDGGHQANVRLELPCRLVERESCRRLNEVSY
ncbi:MAG: LacI family DNA-binding transcriptional regulator [Eubacteriales bacterium]|nr:LacI family DNA-binding transcriptional regulator [Eubacteriales bacterium]